MPQMSPLNWLNLFALFITMFMIMSSLNYFSFTYNNQQSPYMPKSTKLNWKW